MSAPCRAIDALRRTRGALASLAAGVALAAAGLLAVPAQAAQDAPESVWWSDHLDAALRDPQAELQRLRADLGQAQAQGDRHRAWRDLAWLSTLTAWASYKDWPQVEGRSREALRQARLAGDQSALFDLLLLDQWDRVLGQRQPPDPAAMAELESIAATLRDPLRDGLIERLRGFAAASTGLNAEAVVHFMRASETLDTPVLRADLLCSMARSLAAANPSQESLLNALAYLDEAKRLLDPRTHPLFVMPYTVRVPIELALNRPDAAVKAATEAIDTASRGRGARSQIDRMHIALATALLADRQPAAALDALDTVQEANAAVEARMALYLTRAQALALLGRPAAMDDLARARRLLPDADHLAPQTAWHFHEAAAQVDRLRGDIEGALDEVAQGALAHQAMSQQVGRHLIDARLRADQRRQDNALLRLRTAENDQRRQVLTGTLVFAALLGAVVLGWIARLWQRRRTLDHLSERLHLTHEQLQAQHRARTRLLAAACCDLRRPVHTLSLLSEGAVQGSGDPAGPRWLADMVHSHREVAEMLDCLLDMTQLEGGHFRPRPEPVYLPELLDEVESRFAAPARAKGLQFVVDKPEAWAHSDRRLLRRILLHLVSNAVRYTPAGRVEVRAQAQGDRIELRVTDTGPGLPAAQARAAEADAPPADADAVPEGLGLGLRTVGLSARLLALPLRIEAVPGQGTRIGLTLTATRAPDDAGSKPCAPPTGACVAVIDDDATLRKATELLLGSEGYRVISVAEAEGLEDALQAQGVARPDLLVTDLHVGETDGLTLAASLRERPGWHDLPVLLLTGDTDPEVMRRAESMHVAISHKPLRLTHLSQRLAALLQGAAFQA